MTLAIAGLIALPGVACNNSSSATYAPGQQPAAAPAVVTLTTATAGSHGEFLTDGQGRSVYVFLADTTDMSNCSGACLAAWPPLLVQSGQSAGSSGNVDGGLLSTITRNDGTEQVTYRGMPLYYYAGDGSPGMTTGQGLNQFGALWYLVKPDGTDDTG